MAMKEIDLLQGTLDLLTLKTLSTGPMHGYRIAARIQQLSDDVLRIEEGSLYPALYRMEQKGLIEYRVGRHRSESPGQVLQVDPEGAARAAGGNR